jgi:DNA-binding IscR family transcriptional regulator
MLTGGPCGVDNKCDLHGPWAEAKEALLTTLASTTLADVAIDGVTPVSRFATETIA